MIMIAQPFWDVADLAIDIQNISEVLRHQIKPGNVTKIAYFAGGGNKN